MKFKLLFGLYFILALILLPFYLYRISPDATAYFNISTNYSSGLNAINGFWSPLLSWFLAPLLVLHLKPVLAFSIIQLIFGFLTLGVVKKLVYKITIIKNIQFFTVLAAVPMVLYFVYEPLPTPDLLALYFLLSYFNTILEKKINGMLAGIYGALAYFAKTYSLFFFFAHFTLIMLHKRDVRNLLKGICVFLVIVTPWISVISLKYHHFTVGNAGAYNYQVSRPGGVDNPHFYDGLIKPQPNALSSWYDPSSLKIAYHKPYSTVNEIFGWVEITAKNVGLMLFNYEGFSIFAIFLVIYSLLNIKKDENFILIGAFLLYNAGYSIYHIEDRYIWFGAILLLLIASGIKLKKTYIYLLLLSFIVIPAKRLISNVYYRRDVYFYSKSISLNGNIASNQEWNNSLYIAYYNNATYYGITKGDEKEVIESLKRNNINYLLVWNDGPKYNFLSSLRPTKTAKGLEVFELPQAN